jgi:hypothetical protein
MLSHVLISMQYHKMPSSLHPTLHVCQKRHSLPAYCQKHKNKKTNETNRDLLIIATSSAVHPELSLRLLRPNSFPLNSLTNLNVSSSSGDFGDIAEATLACLSFLTLIGLERLPMLFSREALREGLLDLRALGLMKPLLVLAADGGRPDDRDFASNVAAEKRSTSLRWRGVRRNATSVLIVGSASATTSSLGSSNGEDGLISERGDDGGEAETVPLTLLVLFVFVLAECVCRLSEGVRDSVADCAASDSIVADGSTVACAASGLSDDDRSIFGGVVQEAVWSSEAVAGGSPGIEAAS